jgi:hypothetical protein
MELTIDNIIKIAIGVFVIVTVVLGIYFAMTSYVIPYFSGIWSENQSSSYTGGGMETCVGKQIIGQIDDKGYFVYTKVEKGEKSGKSETTKIYFDKEGYIKFYNTILGVPSPFSDPAIGRVYGVRIEIFSDSATVQLIKSKNIKTYTDSLNMAFIGGKEICQGV